MSVETAARQQSTATYKIIPTEVRNLRSYMFEMETKEVINLDRVDNPWAEDIARTLEKIAVEVPAVAPVVISSDHVGLKVTKNWRVELWRDGAVIIKVTDCVLVADEKFLLLCMDRDGLYEPLAKAELITWDGTEEYYTPSDIRRQVKDVLKRVLEHTRWL